MAPSGPVFTPTELKAFLAYVQLFLHAAEVGRASRFDGLAPSQRWAPFDPEKAARKLPARVSNTLARYAWHRAGTPTASDAIAAELSGVLSQGGLAVSDAQLQGALLAGAYWLHAPSQSLITDEKGLLALEAFTHLVNGYTQTLPPRFSPTEHPDSRNRRFRAYQRRVSGIDAAVRTPSGLVRRLPASVLEFVDIYQQKLLSTSAESAYLMAANIAIALGRPVDVVAAAQVEMALATALIWRDISDFPAHSKSHPLLGERPGDERSGLWNAAASRIAISVKTIAEAGAEAMDPKLIQAPVNSRIGEIDVDSTSLDALSLLDDYVSAFAGWIRVGAANSIQADQRVAAFDRSYRRGSQGLATGSSVTSELPANAIKVIAHADALITRQRDLQGLAEELSVVLGDTAAVNRVRRTLETSAAWLHGNLSRLERMRTDEAAETVVDIRDQATLEPFKVARQRDAEALLDLGASVTELVRFSQTLGEEGRPPVGWWEKFHRRPVAGERLQTAGELIAHLPDGSARLLRQYSRVLTSDSMQDASAAARALATTLGRDSEEMCVRTLAVGLSVGAVWIDLERISRGRRNDTLLGAEPGTQSDRLLVGRAHSQLEWGLQELLHTDAIPGL